MYTQCNHCKAIFLVDMKEVTSKKGQLRCGECLNTFNAVDTLSTSMPEKFQSTNSESHEKSKNQIKTSSTNIFSSKNKSAKNNSANLFLASLFLLTFLLAAQVLYQNPSLYSENIPERLPEKVEMLNYNIFAHPSESGVLLISGTIQNNAKHSQPYPSLEIALSDEKEKLVAFSRFAPKEYLSHDTHLTLFPVATAIDLRLKIKDPGSNATQFKFSFK